MADDPDGEPLREALSLFFDWYGQAEGPCPLTLEQHRVLLRVFSGGKGHSEFRRTVLSSARRVAAEDPALMADADRAAEYNRWREELAAAYLDDLDLAPAVRANAALAALFPNPPGADRSERASTRALAGRAFALHYRTRGESADAWAAAQYYGDAWFADESREWRWGADAAELWWRAAGSEARRVRPNQPRELVEESTERAATCLRRAKAIFESILQRSQQTLAASAAVLAPGAAEPGDSWAVVTAGAGRIALAPFDAPDDAPERVAVRDAWYAALAALHATFALERWDEAQRWAASVLAEDGNFGLASGTPVELATRLSETLAALSRLQALSSEGEERQEATQVLVPLIEFELRQRYLDYVSTTSRDAERQASSSIDDEMARLHAALKASQSVPLGDPPALRAFVNRLVEAQRRGRIGLALSGGGFRASFYHLGVLARLADLDLLRSVEVISGVSGGSIVGACYYLKLKALLESRHDTDLTKQDFLDLVDSLSTEFLAGVQSNIRTRIFANLRGLLRLWFRPGYTRTNRVAELIERELFERVSHQAGDPHASIADLRIRPLGDVVDFDPERDNWRRASKAPTYVVNATTLNTGHNWQFTAWTAGEPASAVHELDAVPRLSAFGYRKATYDDGPLEGATISFAEAVAASACVPGLFPPLEFRNLYFRIPVRLVDGGLFDNNGVSALIDRACDVMVVSDGSGQIEFDPMPSKLPWSTLGRMNAVVMERARQLQFSALSARLNAGSLRGLAVTHLTRGLPAVPIAPIGTTGMDDSLKDARNSARTLASLQSLAKGKLKVFRTGHGIPDDLQRYLARVRTDLDCFHDVEAFSLFVSGYMISVSELAKSPLLRRLAPSKMHSWRMAKAWNWMDDTGGQYANAHWLLKVSGARFFKLARLRPGRAVVATGCFSVFVIASIWGARALLGPHVPEARLVFLAAAALIGLAALEAAIRATRFPMGGTASAQGGITFSGQLFVERLVQLVSGAGLPFAFVWSRLQLAFVDPRYLKAGAAD